MYNCSFDDDLADAVKQAASTDMRSVRQQFHYYVTKGLQRDGFLPTQNKTGLPLAKEIKPVTDTQPTTEE